MKKDIESPSKGEVREYRKKIVRNIINYAFPSFHSRYGWFSFILVSWLDPLMRLGYRKPLEEIDLYTMRESDRAAVLLNILDPFWDGVRASQADPSVPMPSLFSLLRKRFLITCQNLIIKETPSRPYSHNARIFSAMLKALAITCTLTIPIFVQQFLYWLQKDPQNTPFMSSGVGLAFCLFGLNVGGSVFDRTSEQLTRKISINFKTLLISAVYRKSLRLSPKASKVCVY
ncbi:hypothetical protein BDK51DRAFT_44407 [Blyttiomyces helicus]|uniref:ABC transmembrane type-1 domain-containing protein n=1 Tax=Blyttiomyces helicus TaxID=388810 RepID=A0A4P9W1D4_9FUNG|nr:hypothetical protein BDK51DRAFT_44407 [Blyttiomyces helicus]|eukprot:RKO85991.1 hypothetical protein BDK51DRAFT_44407 [Blyttiomyces helicus]